MHNFDKFFIFVFLLLLAGRVEAKITLSEQELKGKMIDDKILSRYLSKEGIVASAVSSEPFMTTLSSKERPVEVE